MNTRHESFLYLFFIEMNRTFSNKWCVLHSYETLPYYSESDVDMAFSSSDIDMLELLIKDVADESGWMVYQKLWYDSPTCIYYVLKNEKNIFLALDFLIDNEGIGRYGFSTSLLTKECKMYHNLIPIPNNTVAFSYKYVKRIVKQRSLLEDEKYLLDHYMHATHQKVKNILIDQFGISGMGIIDGKLSNNDFLLSNEEMNLLVKKKKDKFLKSMKVFKKNYWESIRTLNRLFYPCGLVIYIPELSEREIEIFLNLIIDKVGLLFRFVTVNNSGSAIISFKGLVGSTLVIVPVNEFDGRNAIKIHWLSSRYKSIDIEERTFQKMDVAVEKYYLTILDILQQRNKHRMENNG